MARARLKSASGKLWEACIGLEVHAQVRARAKLFSGASAETTPASAGGGYVAPNTQVALLDAALPGTLPVLNREAVAQAVRTGLALGCAIQPVSRFERKHYFYCDLPQGYQITQQAAPIALGGALTIEAPLHDNQRQRGAATAGGGGAQKKKGGKGPNGKHGKGEEAPRETAAAEWEEGMLAEVEGIDAEAWDGAQAVRIARIQLEQDSGKSSHGRAATLVDLNRAGSALMEIVFEPDLSSPAQAAELLRTLQATLRHLGTCDGNLEQGSIRCDLNVSVRPAGAAAWGPRAEVKNMNSLKSLQQAAAYEIRRQIAALEVGRPLAGETRAFNAATGATRRMRAKEGAVDYRFFPEPDLPPLVLDAGMVQQIKDALPELPQATRRRLAEPPYGLSPHQAAVLVGQPGAVAFFEAVVAGGKREAKHVANWICNDLFGLLKASSSSSSWEQEEAALLEDCPVTAGALGELLDLLAEERISVRTAKEVLALMVADAAARGQGPAGIVEARGWQQVGDEATLRALAAKLVADPGSARQRRQYREGRLNMLKYFVGQAMKETGGRAHPEKTEALLRAALDAWREEDEGAK